MIGFLLSDALPGLLLQLASVAAWLWVFFLFCLKQVKRFLLIFRIPDISFFQGRDGMFLFH